MSSATSPIPHEHFDLGPHKGIPRLFCGLWQLSSNSWGSAPVPRIRKEMKEHVDLGFTAFGDVIPVSNGFFMSDKVRSSAGYALALSLQDRVADHYGSAEIIFGQFRNSLPSSEKVIGATKWCVFKPTTPSRAVVEAAVRERLTRMQTDRIDLLQFHWQDYSDKGYLYALEILNDLRAEGVISAIGLCNFDTIRTDEICTQLGPGVIVSNQIQFSLIDTRPLHGMTDVCARHGVKLLTYGTLASCGGFLADRWLGQPEPDLYAGNLTPSQRKYLDMIVKAWGTWALFQALLRCLRKIGDRHSGLSIANVATRWVLDQPCTRLGLSSHLSDNAQVYGRRLTSADEREIEDVLREERKLAVAEKKAAEGESASEKAAADKREGKRKAQSEDPEDSDAEEAGPLKRAKKGGENSPKCDRCAKSCKLGAGAATVGPVLEGLTEVVRAGFAQSELHQKAELSFMKKTVSSTRTIDEGTEVSAKTAVDGTRETAKLARAMKNIALLGSAWMKATHPEIWSEIEGEWESEPTEAEEKGGEQDGGE
ncbi:NADP-dependent oxidoreductase domain-containing protein [Mycena rosella]|uniref:NADP-dependent oxidoreductase domain-containing protein n=1 Tax=Mycena rosella TaxID=1033263 RepID=A0AAD7DB97_MYCRO|nr:NADP-dependent oxidoreductase domain-containing protein [Mycena rosella]